MIKNLQTLKFNMTPEMAEQLNIFFNLKMKLELLKRESLESNNLLSFDDNEISKQIEDCKQFFIKLFRENNKNEIKEYINITTNNK